MAVEQLALWAQKTIDLDHWGASSLPMVYEVAVAVGKYS